MRNHRTIIGNVVNCTPLPGRLQAAADGNGKAGVPPLVRTTLSGVTTFPIVYAICMGTVAVSPYYTGNNVLF